MAVFLAACAMTPSYETVFVPNAQVSSWVQGCYLRDGERGSFVAYVPKGSTCEYNHEILFIAVEDSTDGLTLESLRKIMNLRKAYLSTKECVHMKVLQDDSRQIVWEETATQCADGGPSYSITKVLLGREEIHRVEYTNTKPALPRESKMFWRNNIQNAYVEKNFRPVYENE